MTNELRRLVLARLNTIKTELGITDIGYRLVRDDTLFPHIILDFPSITPMDMGREDFMMDVHIWSKDQFRAFEILDAVKYMFAFLNAPADLPGQSIFPTFYELSAGQIEDPDKTICHLVLRLQGQAYPVDATNSGILGKE